MPVPSISILKLLMSVRKSSGFPSSNFDIFILYVSYVADVVFLRTFTLLMCVACYSSNSKLMSGIGGGSMHNFKSALSHGPLFMVECIDLVERSVFMSHVVTLQSAV